MKKRIFKIIVSCLALTFIYFLLDINDSPAGIGIHSEKINWDIASIVIGNLVVIGLLFMAKTEAERAQFQMDFLRLLLVFFPKNYLPH